MAMGFLSILRLVLVEPKYGISLQITVCCAIYDFIVCFPGGVILMQSLFFILVPEICVLCDILETCLSTLRMREAQIQNIFV